MRLAGWCRFCPQRGKHGAAIAAQAGGGLLAAQRLRQLSPGVSLLSAAEPADGGQPAAGVQRGLAPRKWFQLPRGAGGQQLAAAPWLVHAGHFQGWTIVANWLDELKWQTLRYLDVDGNWKFSRALGTLDRNLLSLWSWMGWQNVIKFHCRFKGIYCRIAHRCAKWQINWNSRY